MNGSRVLQIMGVLLLLLGGAAVAVQLSSEAPNMVTWLGATGPVLMGIALLVIARQLGRER